jgi:hypothetical protein
VFELTFTPEEVALRAELRAWLAAHLSSGPMPEDETSAAFRCAEKERHP